MNKRAINPSHSGPGQRENICLNFYFHISLGCLESFMKVLKGFIKPFETPKRSVKIKI